MFILIAYVAGIVPQRVRERLRLVLEVILHIGAHRTGTTSFQRSLCQNRHNLRKNGIEFWSAQETRSGRFDGLTRPTLADEAETARLIARNQGSIRIDLEILAKQGRSTLLISEENILGSMRTNLREHALYPRLEQRLARFSSTFGKTCSCIGIAIRPYEDFWSSSLAFAIPRGHRAPTEDDLDRLVTQPRTWRRVISDIASAFPGADIKVWEFAQFAGHPSAQLRVLNKGRTGCWIPPSEIHANSSVGRDTLRQVLYDRGAPDAAADIVAGNGTYMPFAPHHIQCFRELYAEDMAWLRQTSGTKIELAKQSRNQWAPRKYTMKRGVG